MTSRRNGHEIRHGRAQKLVHAFQLPASMPARPNIFVIVGGCVFLLFSNGVADVIVFSDSIFP